MMLVVWLMIFGPQGKQVWWELLKVPALLALSCSATGCWHRGGQSLAAAGPLRGTGDGREADPSPLKAEWWVQFLFIADR